MIGNLIALLILVFFVLLIVYTTCENEIKRPFLYSMPLSEDFLKFHHYIISRAGWISVAEHDRYKKYTIPRWYHKHLDFSYEIQLQIKEYVKFVDDNFSGEEIKYSYCTTENFDKFFSMIEKIKKEEQFKEK